LRLRVYGVSGLRRSPESTSQPRNRATAQLRFDPDAAAAKNSGIYGLPFTAKQAKVVIIPVPFEATTSYGGGTSRGPAAVLAASRQVDLFDHETVRVRKWSRLHAHFLKSRLRG